MPRDVDSKAKWRDAEWAPWRPRLPAYENHEPRPGRRLPPWPEGEDYDAMLEKAKGGKIHGPFDQGRQLLYKG